jgi:hypothetical protein
LKSYTLQTPLPGPEGGATTVEYTQQLPETEYSQVMTRVSVPDSGTLLLGGQKVTAEVETEAGVPILAKLPVVGRIFRNRSTIKDHKILLILVKPTIILQEERCDGERFLNLGGLYGVFCRFLRILPDHLFPWSGRFCCVRVPILAGEELSEELRLLSIEVLITMCLIYNLFCKKLLMLYNVLIIGQGS